MVVCNEAIEKLFHFKYQCPSITDGTTFRAHWSSTTIIGTNPVRRIKYHTIVNRYVLPKYQNAISLEYIGCR